MEVRSEGFSFLCRWDGDQTIPLKCRSVKPDLAPLSGTTWSLNCPNMIRHSANGCLGGVGGGVILSYFIYNHDIVHVYVYI